MQIARKEKLTYHVIEHLEARCRGMGVEDWLQVLEHLQEILIVRIEACRDHLEALEDS